jgi:hypothetical protein
MKKFMSVAALVLVCVMLFGCGAQKPAGGENPSTQPSTQPAPSAPAGEVGQLGTDLFGKLPELPIGLMNMPVDLTDAEGTKFLTGITDPALVKEAMIWEPMTGAQAYSLLLVRVNDSAKAKEVAQQMYDNIDTRKWICVEADTKTAAYCGDLVVFFMVDSKLEIHTTQLVEDAFKELCGGTIDGVIG